MPRPKMTPTALTSAGLVRHPCVVNEETQSLLTSLNAQREHVLGALEGLTEDEWYVDPCPTSHPARVLPHVEDRLS
jgi:hypothetical protein